MESLEGEPNEYQKLILIPVYLSKEIIETLSWTKKNVATKKDQILLYHLRDSLEDDLERLKLFGFDSTDMVSLQREYDQISKDLLFMTAKEFRLDGYNVQTLSLVTKGEVEFDWSCVIKGKCIAVVAEKMIHHPSTEVLFHPLVRHIFITNNKN